MIKFKIIESKNIFLISLILAIAGLLSECIVFLDLGLATVQYQAYIRALLNSLGLSFLNTSFIEYSTDNGLRFNFLNTIFYLLLLSGSITYYISKERETRLLRMVMALVFITNAIRPIISLFSILFLFSDFAIIPLWYWIFYFVYVPKTILLAYLSYSILISLSNSKKLNGEIQHVGNYTHYNTEEASGWDRFTHLILDTILCILICSAFITFRDLFPHPLAEILGEPTAILIFLLIARLIYYSFFEIILGATPAKLFTESRVVMNMGQKPAPHTIIKRTLGRFIPFDSFSYLGFDRWHDSIAATQVVKEIRTGVKASRYLLIFPSLIVLGLGIYFGNEKYESYQSYIHKKQTHEENINSIQRALNNLTNTDIIEIKDINHDSNDKYFLKIESINAGEIIASFIQTYDYGTPTPYSIEKLYEANKDSLPKAKIKLSELHLAFTPDYDQSESNPRTSELLHDKRKFKIERIERLYCPSIHDRGTCSIGGENIGLQFINYGWPATLIEIQKIEGTIEWTNALPIYIPYSNDTYGHPLYIQGTGYKHNEKYKFKMVFADTLERKYTYIVEGTNLERTIQKE